MADIDEKEDLTEEKEKVEPTKEEMAQMWEAYVRNELNTLLDVYLPIAVEGTVGIKYVHPVSATYETHTEYDKAKAAGVQLSVVFTFAEPMDMPKEEEVK